MRTTTVRQFIRGGYKTETDPVMVIANATPLGTWYPAGSDHFPISAAEEEVAGKPSDYGPPVSVPPAKPKNTSSADVQPKEQFAAIPPSERDWFEKKYGKGQ